MYAPIWKDFVLNSVGNAPERNSWQPFDIDGIFNYECEYVLQLQYVRQTFFCDVNIDVMLGVYTYVPLYAQKYIITLKVADFHEVHF